MNRNKFAQLIIFVIVAIDLLGFAIILPLMPRYGDFYNANAMTLGFLMACFSTMQFIFAPIWGRISDRIGRRPVLLVGLVGSTFFYGVFGWISTFQADQLFLGLAPLTWLFLSRIGAGISGATLSTAQAFISDSTTKAERGKGMALIGAAFGVGFTFGPLIGAPFVGTDAAAPPSAWPGYIASMISGTALLIAIFKLPESLHKGSKPASSHWLNLSELRTAISQPTVMPLLATIFIATLAFAQFEMTLPYMTKLIGLSDRDNFYIFAYIGFLLTIFQGGLIRRMIPKLGEFRTGIFGAVCLSAGLLLIAWVASDLSSNSHVNPAHSTISAVAQDPVALEQMEKEGRSLFPILMMVLPVSVLGFAAVTPALQAMLSLGASDSDQGEVLGVGQSMSALARIGGPIAGYGMLELGYPLMPYISGAVLMIVVALLLARLKNMLDRRTAQTIENPDHSTSSPVVATTQE
ncbi:MFS transporter [Rubinisphaera italica]|uniref:Tetracycline resistance protein, class B n=1 Tax=Rubinisphaera italica TaxID=2527969 RepID=A0A5C5XCQ5_9PLAN|nr:MFS transporter [Rubinisphaera italica]TWT59965.1 Tetracycline resistance protein, class B [Rubinisphaera italica]